jgi:polysaccharide pyruvyl transferase WcaK-like protein
MEKVILEGYYNQGNYGDDLLMVVSINFLKQLEVNFKMHKKDLQFFNTPICDTRLGDENLIVKGGGGLFFDFQGKASLKDKIFNTFFSYPFFRKLARYKLRSKTNLILLGVGIGPYNVKSARLWQHLLAFEKVQLFCLRDEESIHFVKQKGYNNVIQTTDLVFNMDLWSQYNYVKKTSIEQNTRKVGIVLRKWMYYDINYKEIIFKITTNYGSENVILYFLQDSDTNVVQDVAKYNTRIYEKGGEENLAKFTKALLEVDLLFTMRAHGAIVGACLNIPTVILPIENKLKNVHKMIPEISYLNPDLYQYDFEKINLWVGTLAISTFENRLKLNQELWQSKKEIIKKHLK